MRTPVLLDLFCGAGGAAKGYQDAGFYVVGVDIKPQPRYVGEEFIQGDALEYLRTADLSRYVAIHASPPCQRYSEATPIAYRSNHPDLIAPTREALPRHIPWVIENVENARRHMESPAMLCGTMFGLPLWRHRYFETNLITVWAPASCNHERRPVVLHPGSHSRKLGPVVVTGTTRRSSGRFEFSVADCRAAMQIDWMTRTEIDEAIPPAYTRYIGTHLMAHIRAEAAS